MNYELLPEDRPRTMKLWGSEELLINTPKYCSKILRVIPGYQCSLHYHPVKDETFIVIEGSLGVEYIANGKTINTVLSGWRRDALHLPPNTPHRFWSASDERAIFIEVSTFHDDGDVVRLEESRAI